MLADITVCLFCVVWVSEIKHTFVSFYFIYLFFFHPRALSCSSQMQKRSRPLYHSPAPGAELAARERA